MKKLAFFTLSLLLAGCTSNSMDMTNSTIKMTKEPQKMTGKFLYGRNSQANTLFIPCGTNNRFRLDGKDQDMTILESASLQLDEERKEAFQPVYVELTGEISSMSPEEYSDTYDGAIRMLRLEKFSSSIPSSCK